MANPEKGEVAFQHDGKTYTLVLNTLSAAKLQRLFNTKDNFGRDVIADMQEIDRLVKQGSIEHQIALFWSSLQKHHPEIVTVDQAADLMDAAGAPAVSALLEAAGLGRIDPKDLEELAKGNPPKNPPVAQAKQRRRRGGNFTSMPGPAA